MNYKSLFHKVKSNSLALGLAGLLSVSAVGCGPNVSTKTKASGVFREFSIAAIASKNVSREIILRDETLEYASLSLWATDYNTDGRFDKIELLSVPKGHRLERYANLDSLELAYQTIMDKVNVEEAESRR